MTIKVGNMTGLPHDTKKVICTIQARPLSELAARTSTNIYSPAQLSDRKRDSLASYSNKAQLIIDIAHHPSNLASPPLHVHHQFTRWA